MEKAKQIGIFEETCETCETCEHYAALNRARERSDGAVIYGYCFGRGDKNHSLNMGKGYPVFLNKGCCKNFQGLQTIKRKMGEEDEE